MESGQSLSDCLYARPHLDFAWAQLSWPPLICRRSQWILLGLLGPHPLQKSIHEVLVWIFCSEYFLLQTSVFDLKGGWRAIARAQWESSGASGGSLHGGASFKVEMAHFATWKKGPENCKNEVELRPPLRLPLRHSMRQRKGCSEKSAGVLMFLGGLKGAEPPERKTCGVHRSRHSFCRWVRRNFKIILRMLEVLCEICAREMFGHILQ